MRDSEAVEGIPLTEAPVAVKAGLAILAISVTMTLVGAAFLTPKAFLGEYSSLEAFSSSTPFGVMLAGLVLGVAAAGVFLTEVRGSRHEI